MTSRLLLVTGPSGAGKTTTADAWASSRATVAAHVSHDAITSFARSGFVSGADSHRDPEGLRQWVIGADVCAAVVEVYRSASIHCAIDAFVLPSLLKHWRRLAALDPQIVVLLPDVAAAIARNEQRGQRGGWRLSERSIQDNHAAMQAWRDVPTAVVLDSTDMTVEDVVTTIDLSAGASR